MLKPLTPSQRVQIDIVIDDSGLSGSAKELLQALKDAEQYWREAVKTTNLYTTADRDYRTCECPFCNASENYESEGIPHIDECPWKLAQDTSTPHTS